MLQGRGRGPGGRTGRAFAATHQLRRPGRELREIEPLLGRSRLLTLTGPGGCGKTRLALAVRDRVAGNFADGARWTWLAPLSDAGPVSEAVARAIGLQETPGLSPAETVAEGVGEREPLLVLDNCEHLVGACAGLADLLLRSCPGLKILATSREALDVAGETVWPVPPLSRPAAGTNEDRGALSRYEAVRLFVERAGTSSSGFALTEANASAVARICGRLVGLPLAIEFAAARVRMLSPAQISARLDDRLLLLTGGGRVVMSRQRTPRATMDWSHGLLSAGEKALFRRLSVFVGGFDLGTAEAVGSGAGVKEGEVLELLCRLVDKSLVLAVPNGEEARYSMLETVLCYAAERLAESAGEEPAVRDRHADFVLGLAEEAEPGLLVGQQAAWLGRLDADRGNLRVALAWYARREARTAALRMAGALWWFWFLRGLYDESRGWLEASLAGGDAPSIGPRRWSRLATSLFCGPSTRLPGSVSRRAWSCTGPWATGGALRAPSSFSGASRASRAATRRQRPFTRRASRCAGSWSTTGASPSRSTTSASWPGSAGTSPGRPSCARRPAAPSGNSGKGRGGLVADEPRDRGPLRGEHARAAALLEEALALSRGAGYREVVAWSLNGLGVLARREGKPGRVVGLLGESLALHSGHLDHLSWLPADARDRVLAEAKRRAVKRGMPMSA